MIALWFLIMLNTVTDDFSTTTNRHAIYSFILDI